MLTELCAYLNNWFDVDEYHKKLPRLEGTYVIANGELPALADLVIEGQCFCIYGSYLNDGVYVYDDKLELNDETFTGVIQSMHIPPDLLKLSKEIEAWQAKYGAVGSEAMSPFNSESFGGYSYSKSAGGSSGSGGSGSAGDPFAMYAARLNRWRKI